MPVSRKIVDEPAHRYAWRSVQNDVVSQRIHELDPDLLRAYASSFYGYGNYRGKWWLVGLEEGGGGSIADIEWRLRAWDDRGRRELEDVSIFDPSPSHGKWWTQRPPLQPTWRKLIRLMHAAEVRPTDADSLRTSQGSGLGRTNSDNCILELMPLPSRSIGSWIYGDIQALPELRSREAYQDQLAATRIARLRERIAEHAPRVVVCYGTDRRAAWERVTGTSFKRTELDDLYTVATLQTLFVMTKHPTRRGVTNAYFEDAGRIIGQMIAS